MTRRPLDAVAGGDSDVLRDVREQLRASEEALQRTQMLLRMAGRLSRMGAWSVELPNFELTLSDEVCALLEVAPGFSPTMELANRFYAAEHHATIAEALRACARAGTAFDVEVQLITAGGRRIWVRAIGEAERDVQGHIRRIQGAFKDIVERKTAEAETRVLTERLTTTLERLTAEEALCTSEERFRLLASATNDAIWDWDLVTNGLWWNEGFERLFGYRREEVASTIESWTTCIHPEDLIRVTDGIHHVIDHGGEGWTDEYRFQCHDGSYAYVLDRGHVMRDAEGKAIRMVGCMTDLTERKRTENALRESNEKFHLLADNITDAFWIRSPDMREVHYISPAFERIWGRSAESLHANPQQWGEFILAEDRAYALDAFAELTRSAPTVDIEYRIVRPDGEIRWVRARGFQVRDAADNLVRLTGIVTDVTERQRVADALKTSLQELSLANQALQTEVVERKRAEDAAETANRSKSEFLANMSHEIRTPLNGVVGMTDLALGTELTTEQREYLDLVKASGDSLLTVIDDILDFSKIEAGKLTVDVIAFDLADCLAAALKLLATRAHVKGLELACDLGFDVPTALVGDPDRLRQIVTNLMGNAIKFTEHGEVVLTVAALTRTARDAILRFSVSDTGIGVAREQQEAIFKPFIQADGSTTRKYGGTGLGLAISTNLVALMGGRLWLESEAGKGSTFHFTVPFDLQQVAAGESRARDGEMMRLRGMPVLVVDDNAVNRRILEATLEHWRMKPVLAGGGREALAAMQQWKLAGTAFPLALLDAQMPEMDGFHVAEEIRNDPALAGAAILILTSAGQPGDAARCRALGMAACLTKPVTQRELLEAMLDVLGIASDSPNRRRVVTPHTVRESRPLRILLAEDNKVNQLVAVRLLERRGHTVVIVATGREALAALDAAGGNPFDLVLMDVQMPEMDGFEATVAIRAREKSSGRHVPIVAMTAHAMKGDEERCLAGGMDGYVSKPIQSEQLFATIDVVVR